MASLHVMSVASDMSRQAGQLNQPWERRVCRVFSSFTVATPCFQRRSEQSLCQDLDLAMLRVALWIRPRSRRHDDFVDFRLMLAVIVQLKNRGNPISSKLRRRCECLTVLGSMWKTSLGLPLFVTDPY